MATIRCHTVPKFYLNYFLQPGSNTLWVYDKKDEHVRPQLPVDTTVIRDYYLSDPDDQGNKDKRAEEFLSVLEGWSKPVLDLLIRKPGSLEDQHKETLAMFLAFTYCRSPRAVEVAKEMNQAGLKYIYDQIVELDEDSGELRKLYNKFSQREDKKTELSYEEFVGVLSNKVSIGINEKHAVGDSFLSAEGIHRKLMEMDWRVCIAKTEHFFITSDAPVTVFIPLPNNQAIFGGGLGLPNVQVTFPLSPRICLYLSRRFRGKVEYVDARYVDEMNRRATYMAERFVISPFSSNRIKRLVEEYAGNYKAPKIDAEAVKDMLKAQGLNLKDKLLRNDF